MSDLALASAALEAHLGPKILRRGEAVKALDPGWHPENLGAGIMALPASTEDVAEIVRICAEHRVGIVPHGGRTGLVGGAISKPGEIALSLERMNRIVSVDPRERVAVVEAGATLQSLIEAAAP